MIIGDCSYHSQGSVTKVLEKFNEFSPKLLTFEFRMFYSSYKLAIRRCFHAGLLCKVPHQEGNEERQGHHHEEWPPRHPGRLPRLWHQDVQDRQIADSKPPGERGPGKTEPLFFFYRNQASSDVAPVLFDNPEAADYICIARRGSAAVRYQTHESLWRAGRDRQATSAE
jgi:hypothetical protein